jgi:hypothetical protein
MAVVSLAVTIGLVYVFKVEGLRFVVAVLIGFFPVTMFVSVIARKLVPPKLLVCENER